MIDYMHHNNLSGACLRLGCIIPEIQPDVTIRMGKNIKMVSGDKH